MASSCILELEAWCEGENLIYESSSSTSSSIINATSDQTYSYDDLYCEILQSANSSNDLKNQQNSINEWISRLKTTSNSQYQMTKILFLSITSEVSDESIELLLTDSNKEYLNLTYVDEINGRNCLHLASISGRLIVLKFLLESLPQEEFKKLLNQSDALGRLPLHYACIHNRGEMVKIFIENDSIIDKFDQDNFSPLLYSIKKKFNDLVALLVENGASINSIDEKGYVPLNISCQFGSYETVEILLKQKLINKLKIIPDAEGLLPIHVVAKEGNSKLVSLLKEYSVDVNEFDKLNHWTALFYACLYGHPKTVKTLLESGADVSIRDRDGHSADYYAAWEGHFDCLYQFTAISTSDLNHSNSLVNSSQSVSIVKSIDTSPSTFPSSTIGSTNTIFSTTDYNHDILDTIPDLELPPPIIPLRKYGHNFLDKKIFLNLIFEPGTSSLKFNSPNALLGTRITVSLRGSEVIPRNLVYPIIDNEKILSFRLDNLDSCIVDLELYSTFGTRINAKTTALSYIFKDLIINGVTGKCSLPLFDMRLRTIGEISFMYQIIKPYPGEILGISKYNTYWKSTTINNNNNNTVGSVLAGGSTATSIYNMESNTSNISLMLHSNSYSYVNASSLSDEYVKATICLTKDNIPILCPNLFVTINSTITIPISDLDYNDFMKLTKTAQVDQIKSIETTNDAKNLFKNNFMSLNDVLNYLPQFINLDLYIFYPTFLESDYLKLTYSTFMDLNSYVDLILTCVFDNVRKSRNESLATTELAMRSRSFIFSSSHDDVCTVLNWKQPNYPVFYSMDAIKLNDKDFKISSVHNILPSIPEDDKYNINNIKTWSLKEATQFALNNNLLGLIVPAKLLKMVPSLCDSIRSLGLVLVSSIDDEYAPEKEIDLNLLASSVNGCRSDGILWFKETIDM